ncbi:C6 transcription factor [Fonsecaea pedrosoi]|nr:C6 transcription factor [Fonsecaea pedrosoi]
MASSEATQELMSKALRSDFAHKPVEESLSELDGRCRDGVPGCADGLVVGPFGVFSLDTTPPQPRSSVTRSESVQTMSGPQVTDVQRHENDLSSIESVGRLSDIHDFLDWPDLFDLDFTNAEIFPQSFDNGLQDLFAAPDPAAPQINQADTFAVERDVGCAGAVSPSMRSVCGEIGVKPDDIDPAEAQLLLTHFKDRVLPQLRIMPVEKKSPWEVNNLNAAVLTLARLTYMVSQPVSYAALANLQALLALSAKHMVAHTDESSGGYWQSFAANIINKAKENLQCALRNEIKGTNAAKYKDLLMAILAMVTYATLYDNQADARAYMIDAERLLRLRGLAKRTISRKARELHHVYTWTRIVEESTFVLRNYESTRAKGAVGTARSGEVAAIQPHSGPNHRLDDFLRLDTSIPDSEIEAGAEKDNETGQHDIHLEDSREFPPSMYTELYGISEKWLSLVSQTTRLANFVDSMELDKDRCDIVFMEAIERRKQRLENMVCAFAARDLPNADDQALSTTRRPSVELARESMVHALNSALVIFFYRRIRRVNPLILQEHVKTVIQALKTYDAACRETGIRGTGSPWPAFMAGCEALYLPQKEYLKGWFERAFAVTGFTRLTVAKACMEEPRSLQNPGQLCSRLTGEQFEGLPQSSGWIAEQFHGCLDGRGVIVLFEKLADRVDLGPQLSTRLQITLRSQRIPQLGRQLRDDIRRTPHCALAARGEAVEGQGIPPVEGGDVVAERKDQLGESGSVARRVLQVSHADFRQPGNLRRCQAEPGRRGDVVVDNVQVCGLVDLGHEFLELLVVDRVVVWRHDHHSRCSGLFGVTRQVNAVPGRRGADARHHGYPSSGVLNTELEILFSFVHAQRGELAGGAAGDEAMASRAHNVINVGLETGFVNGGAVVCEGGDQCHENA